MSIWKSHQFELQQSNGYRIGPLQFWIKRSENEWLIGRSYDEAYRAYDVGSDTYEGQASLIEEAAPEDLEFERWVAAKSEQSIRLVPVLPDRPMVARTVTPLHVPVGHKAIVYLQLPLWVRIEMGPAKKPITLCEIPTVKNSNTWFGDPVSGELCYSLKTLAKSEAPGDRIEPHRALAMVSIVNENTEELLRFERICVRAPLLSLYQADGKFWSNDVRMTFKGGAHGDDVRYLHHKPDMAKNSRLISEAREADKQGILKSGIADIKSWVYG